MLREITEYKQNKNLEKILSIGDQIRILKDRRIHVPEVVCHYYNQRSEHFEIDYIEDIIQNYEKLSYPTIRKKDNEQNDSEKNNLFSEMMSKYYDDCVNAIKSDISTKNRKYFINFKKNEAMYKLKKNMKKFGLKSNPKRFYKQLEKKTDKRYLKHIKEKNLLEEKIGTLTPGVWYRFISIDNARLEKIEIYSISSPILNETDEYILLDLIDTKNQRIKALIDMQHFKDDAKTLKIINEIDTNPLQSYDIHFSLIGKSMKWENHVEPEPLLKKLKEEYPETYTEISPVGFKDGTILIKQIDKRNENTNKINIPNSPCSEKIPSA